MRKALNSLMVISLCFLFCGCGTSLRTQLRWENRVKKWLPIGTSIEEARRIMERHGFRCEIPRSDPDEMECDKSTAFHIPDQVVRVTLRFRNGKLAYPPHTEVATVMC